MCIYVYIYYCRTYKKAVSDNVTSVDIEMDHLPAWPHLNKSIFGGMRALLVIHVYYYRTYEKAVSGGGEREKGGHVLRDTTSRGLCVRVWPPHTSGLWSLEGSLSSLSR